MLRPDAILATEGTATQGNDPPARHPAIGLDAPASTRENCGSMTEPAGVIREGFWICPFCGGRNRGRTLACGGCAAVRAEDVPFRIDENAPEISDAAEAARARAGADWACPSCGTTNVVTAATCAQCGQSRSEGHSRATGSLSSPPAETPAAFSSRRIRWAAGAILVAAGLFAFLFASRDVSLVVKDRSWIRSIDVESFGAVRESAWEGEVPSAARVVSSQRLLHHTDHVQVGTRPVTRQVTERVQTGTRRVKTGTKNLGNGYFEDVYETSPVYETRTRSVTETEAIYEDHPVYKKKFTYDVDRWHPARTAKETGRGEESPHWPDPALADGEREGSRGESYTISFVTEKEKTFDRAVPPAEFDQWHLGMRAAGQVAAARGLVEVSRK